MTSEEIKAQVDHLARKLVENGKALREMCAKIGRLQKALEQEAGTPDKRRERAGKES